jgi:hypothetical protein
LRRFFAGAAVERTESINMAEQLSTDKSVLVLLLKTAADVAMHAIEYAMARGDVRRLS